MKTQKQTSSREAFTLIELLVVIVILTVLAAMVLPAMAGTRTNTKAAQCMNNVRRLTSAWQMYTSDNMDRFPTTLLVANVMDWGTSSDNTNTALLIDPSWSPIARFVKSHDLFKCPADNYQSSANPGPRVMSVSANAILGRTVTVANQIPGRTYGFQFTKFTQLNKPGPANTVVLLDEHPDSIDDAWYFFNVGLATPNAVWRSLPASYHDGAASISFADGHVILKRWQDSRTAPPVTYTKQSNIPVPGNPDYTWMNDRMPYQ
jgi:prepilin-type N-terminal cleavage/methylation domain-containing protein/prepilin-type processing-associated H-X9-DG protein